MPSELSQQPQPVGSPEPENPAESVYRACAMLVATQPLDDEFGLGGKLLYAGELGAGELGTDQLGASARRLLYAANIAGAASLTASADRVAQRQAMRDGVVDFLVTSLEEALRILKNEIRKRQPVSVAVTLEPELLLRQMLDRGVLPDLLPPAGWEDLGLTSDAAGKLMAQGALRVRDAVITERFVTWSVDRDFSRWLPRIDACVKEIIPPDDRLRGRWLRLAPRYLGRIAQRSHGVPLNTGETARLHEAVRQLLAQGGEESGFAEMQVGVRVRILIDGAAVV